MIIYAPVKDANGVWATVRFVNGVGETDNPALVEWFRKHGYRVEDAKDQNADIGKKVDVLEAPSVENVADKGDKNEPDFDSMDSDELRAWAKANGLGGVIKNTRNKEKLLELIRG
jgi:hypothetical protein